MKVTVNACRKKRIKVDVTAVNTRRDVIRIPVKRIDQYSGAEPEYPAEEAQEDDDQAELSAIFDSSEFEDPYYQEEDGLPEIFVKPVRLLNELADSRPELDDLPPYFDPRLMTEEEELAAYSAPERLVPEHPVTEDGEPEDSGKDKTEKANGGDGGEVRRKAHAGKKRRAGQRPAVQEIAENYTTEELLAIIESQQQEKNRRDKEQAELKKQAELERAEKARKLAEERRRARPTREEISHEEDTLFMWWSELDSQDALPDEYVGNSDENESFTQMQITGDIPKAKKRARSYLSAAQEAETGEHAAIVLDGVTGASDADAMSEDTGMIFDNIRGAFSTGTDRAADDSGEVFDSIRGAFTDDAGTGGEAPEEEAAGYYVPGSGPDGNYEESPEEIMEEAAEEESVEEAEEYDEEYDLVEEYEDEDPDTSVNVRYFDRDQHGGRVEVGRSEAIGQEVVVIDNESGRMKRICGIIKHGQQGEKNGDPQDAADAPGSDDNAE